MGRTKENKATVVTELKDLLQETQLAVVIDYQGLSVAEITDLRRRIRPLGGSCKIAKNTLFNIAIKDDENWQPMQDLLKGTTAVITIKTILVALSKPIKVSEKTPKKPNYGAVLWKVRL